MADKVDPRAGEATTANYGWVKPTVGASVDAWGGYINTDLDGIDATVFGMLPKSGGTLTGALTPAQTAGIVGTTAANNANAGAVGEYVTASQSSNVAIANNATVNITSISLTAGDWDVDGTGYFVFSTAGAALQAAISTTSATAPPAGQTPGQNYIQLTTQGLAVAMLPTGNFRLSLASTTTVYLVGFAAFTAGTCNGKGTIQARRRR